MCIRAQWQCIFLQMKAGREFKHALPLVQIGVQVIQLHSAAGHSQHKVKGN